MGETLTAIVQTVLTPLEISHLPEEQRTEILSDALNEANKKRAKVKSWAEIYRRDPEGTDETGDGASWSYYSLFDAPVC